MCYKVEWDSGAGVGGVVPVTGVPLSHTTVQHQELCSPPIAAGDPIPYETQCNLSGTNNLHSTPQPISAADLFYGYGFPEASSANTGYEENEAALLYLIVDDHFEVSLVFTLDKPGNADGMLVCCAGCCAVLLPAVLLPAVLCCAVLCCAVLCCAAAPCA